MKRELDPADKHALEIARKTLRMPDAMLGVMGGPTKEQARETIKRLGGEEETTPGIDPSRLSGGSYYRNSKGRVGVWRGVSYTNGVEIELNDITTGKAFKAKLSDLIKVPRT